MTSFPSGIYNNIFSIPIDQEEEDNIINSPTIPNNTISHNESQINQDIINNNYINESNININKYNNIPWKIFSVYKNNKNKSVANSSKLYVTEILGYNWKIRIKKLLTRNKQKYIRIVKLCEYQNIEKIDENINI